ncbi:hypothetical protein ABT167_24755 [Streptomyces sp. NPDC001792]|uniref:hypothetical protein n=1 Tax=Streptomyces sp. NPDC001792 TaxID=3154524 RepID=UPI00331D2A2C
MATGWLTARSTVTDSTPPIAAVLSVVPAIVAISVETSMPRVPASSTMLAVAAAAAPSEIPAVKIASAVPATIVAPTISSSCSRCVTALCTASAYLSSAFAMSRAASAMSFSQPWPL